MPSLYRPSDGSNAQLISPVTSQKVGQGKFFLASTGKLSLGVAGNLRVTVENPSGSGKTVSVVRIATTATAIGWAGILLNPTTGLPATAPRPHLNAVVGGGLAPSLILRSDVSATTALSGGTDTGLVLGVPAGARSSIDMPPLILTPGVLMGINVPFTGAVDAVMSMYWFED